jgi:hypothetical protein
LSYSTAWKPKNCKRCRFEIGGTFVPKEKRTKTTSPDGAVIVATSADGVAKIISVKANYRENRVFVVVDGDLSLCHHEKCKEARSVFMVSPFHLSTH